MRAYLSFRILLLFMVLLAGVTAAVKATSFEEATDRLLAGDIDGAVTAYESLISKGIYGSAIYANLGLAFQKRNNSAEAALNYYRALMLNPQCAEAKEGLSRLHAQTGLPELTPTWIQRLAGIVTPTFLLIAGEILFWTGTFPQVSGFFKKKPLFNLGGCCLSLVGAAMVLVGWLSDPRVTRKHLAIVVTQTQEGEPALTQPMAAADRITFLLPGTPVTVLSERGDWSYCRLPEGDRVCWIPSSRLSFVRQKAIN